MSKDWQHSRLYRTFRWLAGFRRRHRKALKVIAFLLFFILVWPLNLLGMAPVWSWPVTVQVVDAETGVPLPEVVVRANWPSETGTLAGGPYRWGTIRRMETQTNDKGYFHLSGWIRVGFHNWISETGPEIHLIKAGYWPRTLRNNINKFDEIIVWPEPWISDWNGKVVKLEPMHWREWTKEEWEKQINKNRYLWSYGLIPSNHGCGWMKVPENIVERVRFEMRRKQMVDRHLVVGEGISKLFYNSIEKCGVDAWEYLSQYGMTNKEWQACCIESQK